MRIRPIAAIEIKKFATSGEHPLGVVEFENIVEEAWESGYSRPDWCFVAEENDQFIGRIIYTAGSHEATFFGLHLPWQDNYLEVGTQLLKESLKKLKKAGITHLERRLVSDWEYVDEQRRLLEAIKVPMVQDKARFRWQGTPIPEDSGRLTYHQLEDADIFIEAIRRVTENTLDRLDKKQVDILGADVYSEDVFDLLQEYFESDPEWWQLAYTPENALVGVAIPVKFGGQDEGSIGYIGVVPEHRGKGYGVDLLAKGTRILRDAGLTNVLSDADMQNIPMLKAFEKVGYAPVGTTFVYYAELGKLVR